jgi:hypothetical protein
MEMKIIVNHKENHIYTFVSGEYDKIELISYLEIIRNECEKEKIYRVIFNLLDMKGAMTRQMDRFFFGEEISKKLGYRIKLAGVWIENNIDNFVETVAVNRGANFHSFGDIDSAKKWLLNL